MNRTPFDQPLNVCFDLSCVGKGVSNMKEQCLFFLAGLRLKLHFSSFGWCEEVWECCLHRVSSCVSPNFWGAGVFLFLWLTQRGFYGVLGEVMMATLVTPAGVFIYLYCDVHTHVRSHTLILTHLALPSTHKHKPEYNDNISNQCSETGNLCKGWVASNIQCLKGLRVYKQYITNISP